MNSGPLTPYHLNVRFGSLAVLQHDFGLMTANGLKADILLSLTNQHYFAVATRIGI